MANMDDSLTATAYMLAPDAASQKNITAQVASGTFDASFDMACCKLTRE